MRIHGKNTITDWLLVVREPQSLHVFADYEPLEGSKTPEPNLRMQRIERMAEEDRNEAERKAQIAKIQTQTHCGKHGVSRT